MYADKSKQREANRRHAKAYRERKGMTQGMTPGRGPSGLDTVIPVIPSVTPELVKGMGEWVKLRGKYTAPSCPSLDGFGRAFAAQLPIAEENRKYDEKFIKAGSRVGKAAPVVKKDAWRLAKEAQMAKFLKGVK